MQSSVIYLKNLGCCWPVIAATKSRLAQNPISILYKSITSNSLAQLYFRLPVFKNRFPEIYNTGLYRPINKEIMYDQYKISIL
jgi:hypothetical protein